MDLKARIAVEEKGKQATAWPVGREQHLEVIKAPIVLFRDEAVVGSRRVGKGQAPTPAGFDHTRWNA